MDFFLLKSTFLLIMIILLNDSHASEQLKPNVKVESFIKSNEIAYHTKSPARAVSFRNAFSSIDLTYDSLTLLQSYKTQEALQIYRIASDLAADGEIGVTGMRIAPFDIKAREASLKSIEAKGYLNKQDQAKAISAACEAWGIVQPCLFNALVESKMIEMVDGSKAVLNFDKIEKKTKIEGVADCLIEIGSILKRLSFDKHADKINEWAGAIQPWVTKEQFKKILDRRSK
jgi:hypothetical protein